MSNAYIFLDDRTEAEHETHRWIVKGRDSFMSGWGQAASGYSVAAWACRYEDIDAVLAWVKSRKEMQYVAVKRADKYRPPASTAHYHIYVVRDDHRALAVTR